MKKKKAVTNTDMLKNGPTPFRPVKPATSKAKQGARKKSGVLMVNMGKTPMKGGKKPC